MTTLIHLSDPSQIAAEIEFLMTHCRGPETIKETLRSWAREFARNHWRASEMTRLKPVLDGLVVISHANAAFTLASDLNGSGATPRGVTSDSGGYLTARLLICAILETVDVDDDCRVVLAEHVAAAIKHQAGLILDMIMRATDS